ncbi:MAG: COR domain-containing protein [Hormoscilla sp.]
MAIDAAYREAEQRIEKARRDGARRLDLREMDLTEVPEAIGQLSQLQWLDLRGNFISRVPEAIGQLSQLQELDISFNKINSAPEAIGQLSELQQLNLRGNSISSLPEAIGQLSQLQVLVLSSNSIISVPEAIGKLPQLQVLNLSYNSISSLPEEIGQLSQLRQLDISFNKINSVPEAIGQLSQLQVLYIWGNKISNFPEEIGQLSQLQRLNLSGNQISRLPETIGQLSQLQKLYLGKNLINSLPEGISKLSQLQVLELSYNKISSLPEGISKLSQLQVLNLSGNKISSLPEEIGQLSQLRQLDLGNNPLNPELAAAYSQGTEVVLQYLRSQAQDQIELNEAKLILVGEGEVGKTSLLGALRGEPWVENRDTTHGIEIKPVTLKDLDSDREILLNGWDFGGQPVYRPTHQLFFSAPAVYLVVWKPREGPQQNFIEYWIKLIKHRAPEAKIIIVATHGGPNQRQPDIDSHDIIARFGRNTICGFFHVDSKPGATENHIDELKEAIARVAASLPEVGRKVPAKWQEAREELQATAKAYLSYDEVIALCAEKEIKREEADLFLLISHTLGHLIHYHQDPILKNIVILKPDWLAKAISFVLDDRQTRDNGGLVDFSRLNLLWNDPDRPERERYPEELHPIFRKLMERFHLSYRVVDPSSGKPGETSLIAQLVSDKRPDEKLEANWGEKQDGDEEKQQICRIVDENGNSANAEGLFYQLIVRLHKYSLGRANYEDSTHWKRGLLLDDDYNGRALLEYRGTDLWITVRAAYPEFLIHELRKEVKWLVEHFWRGLKCQVMVPCIEPCGKNEPGKWLFDVEQLINFKRQGMPKFPCTLPGCNQLQDIDGLLRNAPSPATSQVALSTQLTEELQDLSREITRQKEQIRQGFQQLSRNQWAMLSRSDLQYTRFQQMLVDEAKDGPRLFSFQPIAPGFFDLPKWMSRKYQLTLWCEHSRLPLPALNPENPKKGVYKLSLPRKWLVKAKPFLKLMTTTLSLVLPVASAATKVVLDEAAYAAIEAELKLGQETLDATIEGSDKLLVGSGNAPEWEDSDTVVRAEGAILRELHAILKKEDPNFGGLVRVQNKRREFLWVHPRFQYEDEYS